MPFGVYFLEPLPEPEPEDFLPRPLPEPEDFLAPYPLPEPEPDDFILGLPAFDLPEEGFLPFLLVPFAAFTTSFDCEV